MAEKICRTNRLAADVPTAHDRSAGARGRGNAQLRAHGSSVGTGSIAAVTLQRASDHRPPEWANPFRDNPNHLFPGNCRGNSRRRQVMSYWDLPTTGQL